jgi:Leucine-rich repeat (LRR) protein
MSNLQNIVLTNNDLVEINELPRMLKSLMLQENRNLNVNNIPNFSNLENLKDLSLKKTCLNDLENIPNSVEKLEISYNNLKKINNLPKNLKMLDASNCQLKSIDEISLVATNLKYLNLSNNMIEILPTLPDTIEEVNISDNLLVKIENNIMPGQLKVFNIDNNKNLQLSEIQMNNLRNLINPGNLSNSNNLCKKNKTDDISEIIAKICSDMFIPLTGEKNLIKHKYEVKV